MFGISIVIDFYRLPMVNH